MQDLLVRISHTKYGHVLISMCRRELQQPVLSMPTPAEQSLDNKPPKVVTRERSRLM